ncbi:hypothetical protein SAMN05216439_1337 [Methanobrevibacter gottschalkii]|uniref:Uncharacterized protein n=2 Tax=Methanobrevibacter gottschalkii TaxID=190974 RepID=A0A3N5BVV4_9EURY|nr:MULTISPECIES: hypothetical protein [Methanobrevibacter]MCQ2970947.1 hypothetical protein [archaeon]OEC98532.1 hypothetical protein A9505_04640 [Methanobrevibacter sp. A27]RPF51512.1 hypothetical protein EDC42_0839 [Methanobrevibacter gottschalkii DSM 11977]SEK69624.1 hypothetical protein SAMN05216439_1337 [Methanobrevibacter gottschalkii]
MAKITADSKYMELLNKYPLLKRDLSQKNWKFEFLVTPMGKISLWEANLEEVSKHAELSVDETVTLFQDLVDSY